VYKGVFAIKEPAVAKVTARSTRAPPINTIDIFFFFMISPLSMVSAIIATAPVVRMSLEKA
jgi:hypothetical protein